MDELTELLRLHILYQRSRHVLECGGCHASWDASPGSRLSPAQIQARHLAEVITQAGWEKRR